MEDMDASHEQMSIILSRTPFQTCSELTSYFTSLRRVATTGLYHMARTEQNIVLRSVFVINHKKIYISLNGRSFQL